MINEPKVALQNSWLLKEIAALRGGISAAMAESPDRLKESLRDTLDAADTIRRQGNAHD